MKTQNLRIQMIEAAQTRIDMTFAASVTEQLPRLVPAALRKKLGRRSIYLPAIAAQARLSDYAPGELFRLEEGSQVVGVWLE